MRETKYKSSVAATVTSKSAMSCTLTQHIHMLGQVVRAAVVVMLGLASVIDPVIARADVLDNAYTEVSKRFSFKAAGSLGHEIECRGSLGEPTLLRSVARAYAQRRDADFARNLAELQSRLMCLPREGVRAYDLWLGTALSKALALSMGERKHFVQAMFNPSLLVFDAIQYTGNSAVQLVFTQHNKEIRALLADYPVTRFPVYVFGPASGRLLALPGTSCSGSLCVPTVQRLLDMFQDTTRIWPGWCHLSGMIENDFRCKATHACTTQSGYAMAGHVTSAFVRQSRLIGATLTELETLLFLSEYSDVFFGLPFDAAAQAPCGLLPGGKRPWAEPAGDIMSCLLRKRREYEASVFCEVAGASVVDPLIVYGGVGTGVWDHKCVVLRGDELTDDSGKFPGCEGKGKCTEFQKEDFEPLVVKGDLPKARQTAANETINTAARDITGRYNEPIASRIRQQCDSFGVPSCSGTTPDASRKRVSEAIRDAAANAHYDPTPETGNPNICSDPGGCTEGRRYGSIRLPPSFFKDVFDGNRSEALVSIVHEMLHIVYRQLGFPPDAGIPEGQPGPTYTINNEYGEELTCDSGSSHHCLIVQIAAHRGNPREPYRGAYRPRPFVPLEPTPFGGCSAAAERIRTQMACYENLVARVRGGKRVLFAPWKDPRKVYPMPEGDVGLPDECAQLAGSTISRPPLSCGLIHCVEPNECHCGGLQDIYSGLIPSETFRSVYAIDCTPDTELDPTTGKCVPIGAAGLRTGEPVPRITPNGAELEQPR